jgi:hypothetical protein
VVLDEIISENLGYPRSPAGYLLFLKECLEIRDVLNQAQIRVSRQRKRWRVSDVEMAIYEELLER